MLIQKWNFFHIKGIKKVEFQIAFGIKLITGYFLYWIYSEYYGQRHLADIFKFYDDSKIISDVFLSKPLDFLQIIFGVHLDQNYFDSNYFINMNHWDSSYSSVLMNESRIIIKINAVLNVIGFNNYSFNVMSFILLGYLGIILIIKSIFTQIKLNNKRLLFWSIILFPSIMIWTSGILKEPITFLSLGLILYGVCSISKKKKLIIKPFALFLTGTISLFMIKFYVFVCFIPSLISYIIIKKKSINPFKTVLYTSIIILLTIVIISTFTDQYNPIYLLSRKQEDFIILGEFYRSGSFFELPKINYSISNFIQLLPVGLFNGFFRPLPTDIKKTIHILPIIENFILFLSVIFFSIKFKISFKKVELAKKQIIFPALLFTILLYTLTGISTPIIGALIRYKIPGLLFLITALNIIYDYTKVYKK